MKSAILLLVVEALIILGTLGYLLGCNINIPKEIIIKTPGTGETKPPPVAGTATFTADISPILSASCVRCHNAGVQSGGHDFSTYDATLKAVNVGKPGDSILCYVLEHEVMPPRGPFLGSDDVKLICDWISDGAKK